VVPVTSPSVTENVSLASTTVSPLIVTVTSCDSPAAPVKCMLVVSSVQSVFKYDLSSGLCSAALNPPCTAASTLTENTTWKSLFEIGRASCRERDDTPAAFLIVQKTEAPVVNAASCVAMVPGTSPSVTEHVPLASYTMTHLKLTVT